MPQASVQSEVACQQALLFKRMKRVSRERARERRSREGERKGGSLARSREDRCCRNRRACLQARAKLSARPLIWKWFSILMQITLVFSKLKKGFALSPILKLGKFETQKWPIELTCKIESSFFLSVVLAKNRLEKLLASRKLRTTRQKMVHWTPVSMYSERTALNPPRTRRCRSLWQHQSASFLYQDEILVLVDLNEI